MTIDTNARAVGDHIVLAYMVNANRILLRYYQFEGCSRLYVFRAKFFLIAWNYLDVVILAEGFLSEILALAVMSGTGSDEMSIVNFMRMFRSTGTNASASLLRGVSILTLALEGEWKHCSGCQA